MKPRLEKKISKKLVEIFAGTDQFRGMWIDRYFKREHERGSPLTPAQIRHNRQSRVGWTSMPSIGGGTDSQGDLTDAYTILEAYRDHAWTDLLHSHEFQAAITELIDTDQATRLALNTRIDELTAEAEKTWQKEGSTIALLRTARRSAATLRFAKRHHLPSRHTQEVLR